MVQYTSLLSCSQKVPGSIQSLCVWVFFKHIHKISFSKDLSCCKGKNDIVPQYLSYLCILIIIIDHLYNIRTEGIGLVQKKNTTKAFYHRIT